MRTSSGGSEPGNLASQSSGVSVNDADGSAHAVTLAAPGSAQLLGEHSLLLYPLRC
jgi:hypothetical protein